MPLEWTGEHNIGIAKIDSQHKHLISLINQLYELINTLKIKDQAEEVLDKLLYYSEFHFKTEEELFNKYHYPDTAEHLKRHQEFKDYMQDKKEKYKNNELEVTFGLVDFLEDWWLEHIAHEDKKYAEYFKTLDNFNPEL